MLSLINIVCLLSGTHSSLLLSFTKTPLSHTKVIYLFIYLFIYRLFTELGSSSEHTVSNGGSAVNNRPELVYEDGIAAIFEEVFVHFAGVTSDNQEKELRITGLGYKI
jgi:hypothetical protein